jgi:hypothetical protein
LDFYKGETLYLLWCKFQIWTKILIKWPLALRLFVPIVYQRGVYH